jgi:hypothetical protein
MAQDFGQQRQKHRADMDEYSQLSARAAAIEADISIGRDRSHYISIRSLYLSIGSLYISIARDRSLAPLLRKQFITYYCIAQSPSANSEDAHTRMHARTHTFTHKRTHVVARSASTFSLAQTKNQFEQSGGGATTRACASPSAEARWR